MPRQPISSCERTATAPGEPAGGRGRLGRPEGVLTEPGSEEAAALLGALPVAGAAHRVGVGTHHRLREGADHFPEQVRARRAQVLPRNSVTSMLGPSAIVLILSSSPGSELVEDHAMAVLIPAPGPRRVAVSPGPYTTPVDATEAARLPDETSRRTVVREPQRWSSVWPSLREQLAAAPGRSRS